MSILLQSGLAAPAAHRIKTHYWAKPIPAREFDWVATDDNYEPGCPVGYGRTEAEAVADLQEQIEEDTWECRECGAENFEDRDYLRCSCCHHAHPYFCEGV